MNDDDDFLEERILAKPKEYGQDNKFEGKEDVLQVQCFKDVQHIKDGPLGFHIGNERNTKVVISSKGKAYSPEGMKLKAKGVIPGNVDLLICHARGGYHGLAVELKTKGGRLSDEQKYVLDWYSRENYFIALVWSREGFRELINEYWGMEPTSVYLGFS